MSAYIIGLTGGIGSGKTTVTKLFIDLGIDVVDADIVAREVVEPNSPALIAINKHFGSDYIDENGQLNRSLLRTRIFSDEKDKLWLNDLLHPLIRQAMQTQLSQCKSVYCILIAPLLLENKLEFMVNRVLVVDVLTQTQLSRAVKRDPSSREEIQRIIDSQISRDERLAAANDIVSNESDNLTLLKQQVMALHQSYLDFAKGTS